MAPPISKETAQDLKNVIDMVKKIDVDYKKCEPQYRKVEKDFQDAIDDKSEIEIKLFRPQMEGALKDIDHCVHGIKGALGLLGNLIKDEALMADKAKIATINALVQGLVDKQKVLVKHAADGRAMVLDKSQKALAEAKDSAETAESDLSELKNIHEAIKKAVDYIEAQGRKLDDATVKAQEKGDAKLMSAERVKYLELGYGDQERAALALTMKVKKALPTFKDSKQRAEAQWILDDLPGLIERCRKMDKRGQVLALLKIAAKPAAPAPAPAKLGTSQIATIAKFFPIDVKDSKELSKFGKVLNENPHGEWVPKLIKAFNWKKPDVEAGMKKADQLPFVKPLYLIDI